MPPRRGPTIEAIAAAHAAAIDEFFAVHGQNHEPIAVDLGGSHPVVAPGCYHKKPARDRDPNDEPED